MCLSVRFGGSIDLRNAFRDVGRSRRPQGGSHERPIAAHPTVPKQCRSFAVPQFQSGIASEASLTHNVEVTQS